jgi:GNAT superfamily N-acetyltransferase
LTSFQCIGLGEHTGAMQHCVPMLTIRHATPRDVPVILRFIRALAVYEKLESEVVATEADLQATLFGAPSRAEVILAEWHGLPAGFALFFHNYSTFLAKPGIYLEDLYVMDEHRGRGMGQALLAHLAKLAMDRNCARLDWSVLDWNAIAFYERLGAKPQSDWTTYRLTGPALLSLARA